MNLQTRQATADDVSTLSSFLKCLVVPTRVPVTVSRGDDCFALGRLRGGEYLWLLAEDETGIQGALELAWMALTSSLGPLLTAYVAFAGVAPQHRRQGLLRSLAAQIEPLGRSRGARIGAFLYSNNNQPAAGAISNIEQRAINAAPISIAIFPAARVLRPSRDYRYEPALPGDLPAANELLRRRRARATLAPAENLANLLARLSIQPQSCWVARTPGGEVAAFLGYWDQHKVRPITLQSLPFPETCVKVLANSLAPILGRPRLPGNGKPLRLVFALAPAATNAVALGGLVRQVLIHLAEQGYQGMLLAMPQNDPLWANLNPWWALRHTNRPMLVPGDAEVAGFLEASAEPVIDLEYALV